MKKPWRLFERPARWKRRMAERGRRYDGSRWRLRKRYETKEAAEASVRLIRSRWAVPDIALLQFKIMHDDEGRP